MKCEEGGDEAGPVVRDQNTNVLVHPAMKFRFGPKGSEASLKNL